MNAAVSPQVANAQASDKQVAFMNKIVGWLAEKDQDEADFYAQAANDASSKRAFSAVIDRAMEVNKDLSAQARKAANAQVAQVAEAAYDGGPVTGVVREIAVNDWGTYQLVVTPDNLPGVRSVYVTYPAKVRDAYSYAVNEALAAGQPVRVVLDGTVTFKGSYATVKRAKGKVQVALVDAFPTNDQVDEAERAWDQLQATEVPAEVELRCCSHQHGAERCRASVQIMSDVWESCGCCAQPGFQVTTVAATTTVRAPYPPAVELVAWFGSLTPAQQALGAKRYHFGKADHWTASNGNVSYYTN